MYKRTRDRLRRQETTNTQPPTTPISEACLPDTDYVKGGLAFAPSSNMLDLGSLQGLDIGTDTNFI